MKAPPEGFDESRLSDAVASRWSIDVESISYEAVGGGSHHWLLRTAESGYRFMTVDDLSTKSWLGDDNDTAFAGLDAAYRTARLLRDSGLDFVVAPIPATDGAIVVRLDQKFTVAMFPYIAGRAGKFGEEFSRRDRDELCALWGELHQVRGTAPERSLEVPGRAGLNYALENTEGSWSGGAYAERARQWLDTNRYAVTMALERYDRLASHVAMREFVITHGEPHAGNLIRTEEGLRLIDWDTVAMAPAERDLWMLGGDLRPYVEATGREIDQHALDFYRLAWLVTDVAAFVSQLREPHPENANSAHAWKALEETGETLSSLL